MATVMAVSSWVARGAVGLRALTPALERLGHEVIALPTVTLSNHLGHPHTAGSPVDPVTLAAMLDAFDANGWLAGVSAVITGYLPSPDHVRLTESLIARVLSRRPGALILCDPVLGDSPGGLYVPELVADAVRERLVPLATHVKPNAFELAFLTGMPVASPAEAVAAARRLAPRVVLADSVPAPGGALANVLVTPAAAAMCTVPRQAGVPQGTGDLLSALFIARLLNGMSPPEAAAAAAAGVAGALAASRGGDELNLGGEAPWLAATPLPMRPLPAR